MITLKDAQKTAEPPLFTFEELSVGETVVIRDGKASLVTDRSNPYLVAGEGLRKCLVRLVYNRADYSPCHINFKPRTDRVFLKVNLIVEVTY